jgi:hypothetical protein
MEVGIRACPINTFDEKLETVDSWNSYVEAPETVLQPRVRFTG